MISSPNLGRGRVLINISECGHIEHRVATDYISEYMVTLEHLGP